LRDELPPEVPAARRGSTATPPVDAARRLRPPLNRNAAITFVRREELDWMLLQARGKEMLDESGRVRLPSGLSQRALEVAGLLERRGACFFNDLVAATRRLPAEVEDALWELLSRGAVTADAVDNLRVLQSPAKRKRQRLLRRGGPGRWTLFAPSQKLDDGASVEHVARLVLQRYGIVWRDVALREPLAPSWRELAWVYRRMEARGEIRGGRFLGGAIGEQFALNEAVEMARAVRRSPKNGRVVRLSAVDPLNLTAVVTPGPRVPSVPGQFVTYADGVPADSEPAQLRAAR
jgi:ATP-dependent Lhr-like helicase